MPAFDRTVICNRALSRIKAGRIASFDEHSLSAEHCRQFYPETVGDMLEGDHDWSFANQRVTLALLGSNDRPLEWVYAYQLPSNMASGGAIRVIPDLSSAGVGMPQPLPGEPYAETWVTNGVDFATPYIIEGSTLYSNVQNATLEYVINDLAGLNIPNKVITAFTIDLASRLAVPVKGDKQREASLAQVAALAWERAVADDRNRQPQQTGEYVSEMMLARRGYLSEVP
jgi:hypothetical protein